MKRPTAIERVMVELIAYGGAAVRRIDVYDDLTQRVGMDHHTAERYAMLPCAVTPEQAARLLTWSQLRRALRLEVAT